MLSLPSPILSLPSPLSRSFRYFLNKFQYHWTNYEERTDLTDSSGLVLHFTRNLRPYDAAVFLVGSTHFDIPPKQKHPIIRSNCASGCTKTLIKGSINITSAWNHMHTLGRDMMIEVLRNGVHLAYITYERMYSYDSPQMFTNRQPLELYPGDSIVTTCGFNTMSRDDDVSWGDGTYDEMCFGFMTYYPKQNLNSPVCIDIMGLGLCQENSMEGCLHKKCLSVILALQGNYTLAIYVCICSLCQENSMEGCKSLRDFIHDIGSTRAFKEISYQCTNPSKCEPNCARTVIKHMKREPCMRGNIWRLIQDELAKASGLGYEFLRRIAPCKRDAEKAIRDDPEVKRSN
ncbi:hypothetical protein BsWGS_07362 [Bradybaena similaris]